MSFHSIDDFLASEDKINKIDLDYIVGTLDYMQNLVKTTYTPSNKELIISFPKTLSNNF